MKFIIKINRIKIPDSELIADVKRTAKLLKTKSVSGADYRKHGKFHDATLRQRFGRWNDVLKKAGLNPKDSRAEIIKAIIADLKAVARKLKKKTFSCYEYERNGKFKYSKIKRYFSKWAEAMNEAGLKYVKRTPPTRTELLENLKNVWVTLGRQPKHNEIKKPLSGYGKNAYPQHFGTWQKALESLAVYLKNQKAEVVIKVRKYVKENTPRKKNKQKTPRNVDYRMRHLVLKRDNYKCRLCGRSPATDISVILQVDHIKPWASGGETTLDNLQTLCYECNMGKGSLSIK